MMTKQERLHREIELLKKGKHRRSELQVDKTQACKVKLDNLFDMAHADPLMMTNATDTAFLLARREPGRCRKTGIMDTVLAGQEA